MLLILKRMLFILIFLVELTLLFFLSKHLINELSKIFLRISRHNYSFTVNTLAVIFLPGTIIHELAHLLTAGILMVPVGELEVIPEISERGVKLGSVQIGQTDPIRRILIGVAPVLVGISIIVGLIFFNLDTLKSFSPFWLAAVLAYGIFEVSNTMFSSKKDVEGALVFLSALIIVVGILWAALYLTGNNISLEWVKSVDFSSSFTFFQMLGTYMVFPVVLDALLLGIFKLVNFR